MEVHIEQNHVDKSTLFSPTKQRMFHLVSTKAEKECTTSPLFYSVMESNGEVAEIRRYQPLLDIANEYGENSPPSVTYHSTCRTRTTFVMKRDLDVTTILKSWENEFSVRQKIPKRFIFAHSP